MAEIEATFSDETVTAISSSAQADPIADAQWPPQKTPYLIHNSNHQYQYVSQDNTTINNLFREESKGWKDFFTKLFKEILLSIIEPDRLLKNAKAIVWLTLAYTISQMSYQQIKDLIELYLAHCK